MFLIVLFEFLAFVIRFFGSLFSGFLFYWIFFESFVPLWFKIFVFRPLGL